MSSLLLGAPGDRWRLTEAVDALGEAARRAGAVPSTVWIAGAFYPSLNLNLDLVRGLLALVQGVTGVEVPYSGDVGPLLALFGPVDVLPSFAGTLPRAFVLLVVLLPLFLLVYRLIAGLARRSDPHEAADRPRLRTVWRAGKGLAGSALGLWLVLLVLLFGALLFTVGPVLVLLKILGLESFSALFAGLLLPALVLLLAYATVLMVLNQLALHSLAHNRRGVASALTHAWRLVRASPMGATRATLVDLVLSLSVAALVVAAEIVLDATLLVFLVPVAAFLLYGFAGVTRARFWAHTYRALGGLSPADRVPGLGG